MGRNPNTAKNGSANQPVTGSYYSLPEIISKINPQDNRFLKYIPDNMLNNEQILSKRAEENRINKSRKSSEKIHPQRPLP